MATTASAYLSTYPNHETSPTDFCLLIEGLSLNASGKLSGVQVTNKNVYSSGVGVVAVSAGWCVVRGRIIRIEAGDVDVSLASSGTQTKYVYLVVDLSSEENNSYLEVGTSVPSDSSDFNVSNGRAYLKLASMSVTSSAISSVSSVGVLSMSSLITEKTGLLTKKSVVPEIKASFTTATVNKDNVSIKAGKDASGDIDISKSNLTPIGLSGFFLQAASKNGANVDSVRWTSCYIRTVKSKPYLHYLVHNDHASKAAVVKICASILYAKNT